MAVRTVGRVAFPPIQAGEDENANEARYRAAVDQAMGTLVLNDFNLDGRLSQIEEGGLVGGGSPNLDGGKPDSNYGGISAIDGGVP